MKCTFSLLLLLGAAIAHSLASSAVCAVPASIPFSGVLVDASGAPVTTGSAAGIPMRFGLFLDGTRVWYAQYSAVNVVGGSFTVHLGADPAVASALDPSTGLVTGSAALPVTPDLVPAVSSQTKVEVEIEVTDGNGGFQPLSPRIPVSSSLFALRAASIGGIDATHIARLDDSGAILDGSGHPVISSSGLWLGSAAAAPTATTLQSFASPAANPLLTPQAQGFPFTGPFNSGSSYAIDDLVTYDGSVWLASGSTSGLPQQDPAWTLFVQGFGYQGIWNPDAAYYTNDVVFYAGCLYVALNHVINDVPPRIDTANWSIFTEGFNPTGNYVPGATYYPGDVVYYSGTGYYLSGTQPDATGTTPDADYKFTPLFSKGFGGGDPGPQGVAGPSGVQGPPGPPTFAGARFVPLSMHATALAAVGGEALIPAGTPSGNPQPDAYYVLWLPRTSGVAGESGPFDQTQSRYHPILSALIRTGTSIAKQRIWVGLSSASLAFGDGVGPLATRYIGVRYSTHAGDANWQLASGDGTVGSSQDTGFPVQPDTVYLITLNWSVDGQLACEINGVTCAAKTTNLDTGNPTPLGIVCATTSLGSPASSPHRIAYISLKYDGNNF